MTPSETTALLDLWKRWPECAVPNMEFGDGDGIPARWKHDGDFFDDGPASDLACAAIERQLGKANLCISYVNGRLDLCAMRRTAQGWDYVSFGAPTKLTALIAAANEIKDREAAQ